MTNWLEKRSWMFWAFVLVILVVLFLLPPTRAFIIFLLPLGRGVDDLLVLFLIGLLIMYVGLNTLVLPPIRWIRLQRDKRYARKMYLQRIHSLQNWVLQWVGTGTPEESMLYMLSSTPATLQAVTQAQTIVFELPEFMTRVSKLSDTDAIPELQKAYVGLTGNPAPHVSWMKLVEMSESKHVTSPLAAIDLKHANWRLQGDWMVDYLVPTFAPPRVGALGYLIPAIEPL